MLLQALWVLLCAQEKLQERGFRFGTGKWLAAVFSTISFTDIS
jgi:hypothetical protein